MREGIRIQQMMSTYTVFVLPKANTHISVYQFDCVKIIVRPCIVNRSIYYLQIKVCDVFCEVDCASFHEYGLSTWGAPKISSSTLFQNFRRAEFNYSHGNYLCFIISFP